MSSSSSAAPTEATTGGRVLVGIGNDFEHAKTILCALMHGKRKTIAVVCGVATSKTQLERFKKWARFLYFISPTDDGFLVHAPRLD